MTHLGTDVVSSSPVSEEAVWSSDDSHKPHLHSSQCLQSYDERNAAEFSEDLRKKDWFYSLERFPAWPSRADRPTPSINHTAGAPVQAATPISQPGSLLQQLALGTQRGAGVKGTLLSALLCLTESKHAFYTSRGRGWTNVQLKASGKDSGLREREHQRDAGWGDSLSGGGD